MSTNHPPLNSYARVIVNDWDKVSPYAEPYLDAMFTLKDINDEYIFDSGRSVVGYFLANARTWRGETARRVKLELNHILKHGSYKDESITEEVAHGS